MTPKGRPHPSGRPLPHREVPVGRPIWRVPDTEPNVPRLRTPIKPDCIGFIHRFPYDEVDDNA